MSRSETWFLLEQEGYLARSCLCNGLSALRKANLGNKKGFFYSAFFELSIGFERTMKLILIIDHMAKNKLVPPDHKTVENYKHDLLKLFGATKDICIARNLTTLDSFDAGSLSYILLTFLANFADTSGRYANINKLTGHRHQTMSDPLVQWNDIVNRIIREHATKKQRQHARMNGQIATSAFGGMTTSQFSDLNKQRPDVDGLHTRTSELDVAAKYAIFALITLIASLREVLDSAYRSTRMAKPSGQSGLDGVPDMKEFFQFAYADKKYVMRKMRWP